MRLKDEFTISVTGSAGVRQIAVNDIGSKNSKETLMCLPGILEVKSTFLGLQPLIERGYRIVTLDYCGRGRSDYLENINHYKTSTYIEDVLAVYDYIIQSNRNANPLLRKFKQNVWRLQGKSIHMLGNSMGGLIAAAIAMKKLPGIKSLILNDISSLIPWSGLFSLYGNLSQSSFHISSYGNFNNSNDLAKTLNVDPKLLKAVMQTTHLDIPFHNTIHGIEFKSIFNSIAVPLCLIYSSESKLVTKLAINNIKKYSETILLVEESGSSHPVKFQKHVVNKIHSFISHQY